VPCGGIRNSHAELIAEKQWVMVVPHFVAVHQSECRGQKLPHESEVSFAEGPRDRGIGDLDLALAGK
jgi:hypothetical protein